MLLALQITVNALTVWLYLNFKGVSIYIMYKLAIISSIKLLPFSRDTNSSGSPEIFGIRGGFQYTRCVAGSEALKILV